MDERSGRLLADVDGTRGGEALEPRSDIRRVTDCNGLRLGRADEADGRLTRVDPNAGTEVGDAPD